MTHSSKVVEIVLLASILAVCVALLCSVLTSRTQYVECGMCGAHVSEWWYVQDDNHKPIEVCEHCYELCQ
jgi:hypothetical protein